MLGSLKTGCVMTSTESYSDNKSQLKAKTTRVKATELT